MLMADMIHSALRKRASVVRGAAARLSMAETDMLRSPGLQDSIDPRRRIGVDLFEARTLPNHIAKGVQRARVQVSSKIVLRNQHIRHALRPPEFSQAG